MINRRSKVNLARESWTWTWLWIYPGSDHTDAGLWSWPWPTGTDQGFWKPKTCIWECFTPFREKVWKNSTRLVPFFGLWESSTPGKSCWGGLGCVVKTGVKSQIYGSAATLLLRTRTLCRVSPGRRICKYAEKQTLELFPNTLVCVRMSRGSSGLSFFLYVTLLNKNLNFACAHHARAWALKNGDFSSSSWTKVKASPPLRFMVGSGSWQSWQKGMIC